MVLMAFGRSGILRRETWPHVVEYNDAAKRGPVCKVMRSGQLTVLDARSRAKRVHPWPGAPAIDR
jgi:hypothetical protein